MDNLQTEMLEIEFLAYSRGMTTISEEDFARILLRYTTVDNISSYLENVRQSIPDEKVKLSLFYSSPPIYWRDSARHSSLIFDRPVYASMPLLQHREKPVFYFKSTVRVAIHGVGLLHSHILPQSA